MRTMLIVIDCLRYDHSDVFNFDGFQKLNRVVSVSNWTRPVLGTLLTGLSPLEHGAVLKPLKGLSANDGTSYEDTELIFLQNMERKRLGHIQHEMLTEKYQSRVIFELPVYGSLKDGYGGVFTIASEMGALKESVKTFKDSKTNFVMIHLKGGHSPFEYSGLHDITPENYRKELKALKGPLEGFVADATKHFDRIAIIADHGRIFEEVDGREAMADMAYGDSHFWGHGGAFHLSNLHVPLWLYPNENLADTLYDSRIVHQFLERQPIISPQVVFSSSPAYYDFNRIATTYLVDGKLVSENYKTTKGWDI